MKVYEIVNQRIADLLAKGTVPWHQTWKPAYYQCNGSGERILADGPYNLHSRKPYRGMNVWVLQAAGYASPWWLTYNQARLMGGHVKEGSKGTPVFFWNFVKKASTNRNGDEVEKSIPFLRYYTVFNLEQVELPEYKMPKVIVEDKKDEVTTLEAAEAVVDKYVAELGGPDVVNFVDQNSAYYSPAEDKVVTPTIAQFDRPEDYYSTLFHELGHSTGHQKRLGRDWGRKFGDPNYAREELCAEMTAAYLCAHTGVEGTFDNSAAYLEHWQQQLKDDSYLFITAAGKAQAAADHILGKGSAEEADQAE